MLLAKASLLGATPLNTIFTLFLLGSLFRYGCDLFENFNCLCGKFTVLDIEYIMLLCAVIRYAALGTGHKLFDFGKFFYEYRVVADKQDGFIVHLNHILAEHLFIPHIFSAGKLFTDKFYIFL